MSRAPRAWARGFRAVGRTRVNVSAGIGCERTDRLPAIRFFCPPEVTLIELAAAPGAPGASASADPGTARAAPRRNAAPGG